MAGKTKGAIAGKQRPGDLPRASSFHALAGGPPGQYCFTRSVILSEGISGWNIAISFAPNVTMPGTARIAMEYVFQTHVSFYLPVEASDMVCVTCLAATRAAAFFVGPSALPSSTSTSLMMSGRWEATARDCYTCRAGMRVYCPAEQERISSDREETLLAAERCNG